MKCDDGEKIMPKPESCL